MCCAAHVDLLLLLRAVVISATKDGVKFSSSGDVGTANITVRQNTTADKVGLWHSLLVAVATAVIPT